MKTCSKCWVEKPLEEFATNKGGIYGLRSWCRGCMSAATKARYWANPEKSRAASRARVAANPEKYRAKCRAWVKANPEKQAAMQKAWRGANPDKCKNSQLLRDFGISLTEYRARLAAQDGVCAICQKPERSGRSLSVDHHHDTGKVRGLLCDACNTALGKFGDSAETLRRATAYLEK